MGREIGFPKPPALPLLLDLLKLGALLFMLIITHPKPKNSITAKDIDRGK